MCSNQLWCDTNHLEATCLILLCLQHNDQGFVSEYSNYMRLFCKKYNEYRYTCYWRPLFPCDVLEWKLFTWNLKIAPVLVSLKHLGRARPAIVFKKATGWWVSKEINTTVTAILWSNHCGQWKVGRSNLSHFFKSSSSFIQTNCEALKHLLPWEFKG